MPACTYFSDSEIEHFKNNLQDPEIQEELDFIHKHAVEGTKLVVEKKTYPCKRGWFRKPGTKTYYHLYSWVNITEWQIINFARNEEGSSFNFLVGRGDVLNFLMGWANGLQNSKKKPHT